MTQEVLTPLTPDFTPYSSGEEWLAQYIFGSFYFSQGDSGLQSDIDNFAFGVIATEEQRHFVANAPKGTTLALANQAITKFFEDRQHLLGNKSSISSLINLRISLIRIDIVNPLYSKIEDGTLLRILSSMATQEEKFLGLSPPPENDYFKSVGHRAIPGNPRHGTSPLLLHLVDKKDARHPLFNGMFEQMRQLEFDPETVRRMQGIESSIAVMKKRDVRDIGALVLSFKDGHE